MKRIAVIISLLALAGCTGFLSNIRNAEVTTTHLTYMGYVGWTNYYHTQTNHASPDRLAQLEDARRAIKNARMEYAASVNVLDAWVAAYETNSVTKAQLQAALDATIVSSSNVLWLVKYIQQSGGL